MTIKTRVILVGVGGATCSGKTTLAKHLKRILPDSVIIHQDDFAPPQEMVPVHPVYNVQDWDAAPGAIVWPKLIKFLEQVKECGVIPPDHRSHDHLNKQKIVQVDESVMEKWRELFHKAGESKSEKIVWGLVDGFLLYWHPEVIDLLDVRLFLRAPEHVLKKRRQERSGYHTAVQTDPEGDFWQDPPGYWEQIVYPAYLDAHRDVFVDGDIDEGKPTLKVRDMIVLETTTMDATAAVERCCGVLWNVWNKHMFWV